MLLSAGSYIRGWERRAVGLPVHRCQLRSGSRGVGDVRARARVPPRRARGWPWGSSDETSPRPHPAARRGRLARQTKRAQSAPRQRLPCHRGTLAGCSRWKKRGIETMAGRHGSLAFSFSPSFPLHVLVQPRGRCEVVLRDAVCNGGAWQSQRSFFSSSLPLQGTLPAEIPEPPCSTQGLLSPHAELLGSPFPGGLSMRGRTIRGVPPPFLASPFNILVTPEPVLSRHRCPPLHLKVASPLPSGLQP